MLRIISFNLNGIRAAVRKGFLEWLPDQNADFICLQELKAQTLDMTAAMLNPLGYYGYFNYAEKKGYSGVGIYTRLRPQQIVVGLKILDRITNTQILGSGLAIKHTLDMFDCKT